MEKCGFGSDSPEEVIVYRGIEITHLNKRLTTLGKEFLELKHHIEKIESYSLS